MLKETVWGKCAKEELSENRNDLEIKWSLLAGALKKIRVTNYICWRGVHDNANGKRNADLID